MSGCLYAATTFEAYNIWHLQLTKLGDEISIHGNLPLPNLEEKYPPPDRTHENRTGRVCEWERWRFEGPLFRSQQYLVRWCKHQQMDGKLPFVLGKWKQSGRGEEEQQILKLSHREFGSPGSTLEGVLSIPSFPWTYQRPIAQSHQRSIVFFASRVGENFLTNNSDIFNGQCRVVKWPIKCFNGLGCCK